MDMIGPIGFLVLWLLCGVYGVLANIERIPRIWGKPSKGDAFQHLLTLLLGPIGIVLVMDYGGRWDFWNSN